MFLLFVTPDILGRHVTGVCWIRNSKKLINLYFIIFFHFIISGCWEYLYIWIIIIYTSSCILLVSMANCLNQLPIYQEELLQVFFQYNFIISIGSSSYLRKNDALCFYLYYLWSLYLYSLLSY